MNGVGFPPTGASARLHNLPAVAGRPACWAVLIAVPPVEAAPESLLRPGEASALLTRDSAATWPDAAGERLAAETLRRGGVAALACKTRIGGGAA